MKTAFLILYFWHANARMYVQSTAMNGGPVLQFVQMPNLAACELVGRTAKQMTDESAPRWQNESWRDAVTSMSVPTVYRCVEVAK